MNRIIIAGVLFAWIGWFVAGANGQSNTVAVVVENGLYESLEIKDGLDRYLSDITAQGFTPLLVTTFTSTSQPADLRTHLSNQYNAPDGLAGTVFIGRLPVQNVYTLPAGGIAGEYHPCDLYYTDLDGTWSSSGANGYLPDTHTGAIGPEIWLGRLTTWNLTSLHAGRTEASLLNDYFAKNHAYRTGALTVPRTGLSYTDDDWDHTARVNALALAVEGAVTDVWNLPTTPHDETTVADYKSRLAFSSYEHVLLSAHSSATGHSMNGWLGSSELEALSPEVLFYNLFACSSARYTEFGYLAGEYVFGAGDGLVAVGTTKTGGMMSNTMGAYFQPLGEGSTFGEAMLNWWHTAVDPDGHTPTEQAWYYGMTTIGDPLLVTQPYVVPEPSTLAMALTGVAVLWLRRRHQRHILARSKA
jgi:hypothetical protein